MNAPLKTATLTNRTAETVASEILAARKALAAAQAVLDGLTSEITDMLDERPADAEGSKTFNLDGFRVEVKRAMNRKTDDKGIDAIAALKLGELTPLKTKVELDQTGLKYLRNNEPAVYARVAKFIEAKPAKVAVTVSRID